MMPSAGSQTYVQTGYWRVSRGRKLERDFRADSTECLGTRFSLNKVVTTVVVSVCLCHLLSTLFKGLHLLSGRPSKL